MPQEPKWRWVEIPNAGGAGFWWREDDTTEITVEQNGKVIYKGKP